MWECKKCGCTDFYSTSDIELDKQGNIKKLNEIICCTNCDNYGENIKDIAMFKEL